MERARFSERVLLNRERFTEFEETFSLYVLANPGEAAARTVSDLASSFHISPNAIVRFAHKLGYEGFSDMRLSLAHELDAARSPETPCPTVDLVRKTLERCRSHPLEERAARILASARRVVFYAVGETAYIAHAFANRMTDFDEKTHFLTYENQIVRELGHGEGLALVLVSLTGETPQVVGVAKKAYERNADVITLTDLHPNTLAQYAKVALYCCSPRTCVNGATATDLTPLVAALTSLERAYLHELGLEPESLSAPPAP